MDDFLKIVVFSMNTYDGNANSADHVKHFAETTINWKRETTENKILKKGGFHVHYTEPYQLSEDEKYSIYRTTLLKYKILRIRSKISYMAFLKK